jgi:hypothetical protein
MKEWPSFVWNAKIKRDQLSSGYYKTWDYGINNDELTSKITLKDSYTNIKNAYDIVRRNDAINMTFIENEFPFGPDIYTLGSSQEYFTFDVEQPSRVDLNLWELAFSIVPATVLTAQTSGSIPDLIYPDAYTQGYVSSDVINSSTYGDVYISSDYGRPYIQDITFTIDYDMTRAFLAYIITTIRGNAFTLPTTWTDLNPFFAEDFDSMFILDLSLDRNNLKSWSLTLKLQGYKS